MPNGDASVQGACATTGGGGGGGTTAPVAQAPQLTWQRSRTSVPALAGSPPGMLLTFGDTHTHTHTHTHEVFRYVRGYIPLRKKRLRNEAELHYQM